MNTALIFAGGAGHRMNTKTRPKQFLELHGKPILIHTIDVFDLHPEIDSIAVVCLEPWIPYAQKLMRRYQIEKVRWIVAGGDTGQQSIRNGLDALEAAGLPEDTLVLIHDGVRPLIDFDTISRNIACAGQYGNAITVTPAIETIIDVTSRDEVNNIMDRSVCRLARAPQTFRLGEILGAHKRAETEGKLTMIDSAMLMSYYGAKLHIVEGPAENIKITTPSDFYVFRAIFEARENSQIWGIP
ncbi:MAG: 2-C-methyl-D-erythritol 4-phosphate cytidylyltransferase [Acidaminococcaceae bacterium]|nr:2-C-methyl-D-erythritol 4-phosphate cytidylyltransferase [Acidaminococcaceae bacterium]